MSKGKAICQQIFLWLLVLLSGGAVLWSALLLKQARTLVESPDFIDVAAVSIEEAAALLEQRDLYASMLRYSLIALVVCVVLVILWYVVYILRKHRAVRLAARTPEVIAAEQAERARKQAEKAQRRQQRADEAKQARQERAARQAAEIEQKALTEKQRRAQAEQRGNRARTARQDTMGQRQAYEAEQRRLAQLGTAAPSAGETGGEPFCAVCGNPCSGSAAFCNHCGAKLIRPGE